MIYLDNSATTRPCAEAVEAIRRLLCETWGNPSSLHAVGFAAERELAAARQAVAAALSAAPEEIVFTSGGTESDNIAILGAACARRKRGRHIVTTQIEHPAVLQTMAALEQDGFEVTYLVPDGWGHISPDAIRAAVRPERSGSVVFVGDVPAHISCQGEEVSHTPAEHGYAVTLEAGKEYTFVF